MNAKDNKPHGFEVAQDLSLFGDEEYTQSKANRHYQEMVDLTRKRQFKFAGTELSENGTKTYRYNFELSEGTSMCFGSTTPIEDSEPGQAAAGGSQVSPSESDDHNE